MVYFILGSQKELCVAELKAVIGNAYQPLFESSQVVILEDFTQNFQQLQNLLAGVIKIGKIFGEFSLWNKEEAADLIASQVSEAQGKNKISFGLSVYDLGNQKQTRTLEKELDALGIEIKKRLKKSQRPVRYVKAREPRLSSAVIETNGLLLSGGEFVLFTAPHQIFLGQTETIQDFRAWEKRDMGRPARDPKSGMLPPKLARIMINLAGVDPASSTLLDPFCGSGTILMEASLLGFQRVIGSDISQTAIHDAQQNFSWLKNAFDETIRQPDFFCADVSDLLELITQPIDAIVTETFLGKPRMHPLAQSEINSVTRPLLELYQKTLFSFSKLIKHHGKLVIAFPMFKMQNGSFYEMSLQNYFEETEFSIEQTFPYHRPDQLIGRQIVVAKRA